VKNARQHLCRFACGVYFVLTALSPCEGAARPRSGALPSAPQVEARVAEAVPVEHAPKLDGTLNDPLWLNAKPITDFRQREPHEGEPPTEKTEVRILYTRHAVYFGIHCYDSEPSRIIATELRRDVSQDLDDHFEILIDSNHNRRGAYVFEINPLGTQNDGLVVEEQGGSDGGDFDRGWDGVWTSEARTIADGWTATIEIPFTTLNFTHSLDVVWGLNFKRFIRRKNEEDLWSAYRRTFGITKVSQAGDLVGIKDIGSGRLFIVKPYGLAQYDKQTGQDPKFPLTGGLDIKYGLTSNVVLNLTGNTDFADTEVDVIPCV
jgi:Carbohydrate family 9 binding domain-like